MSSLTFWGAAGTVTGSQYLVESGGQRLLVDCGMFQGDKALKARNWAAPEYVPEGISWMILTHTHLDHIGRVPRLVKQGFKGRILATPATRALAEVLLKDAAHLQQEDAEYLNRKGKTSHEPALPLFDMDDVAASLDLFEEVPLGETVTLSPGFAFTYRDAGHLLGAASVVLRVRDGGSELRVLFSGDVGRFGAILTKDPELAPEADYMVVESTYGNKAHDSVPIADQLEGVLKRTFARGGVVLIPAFAVGRAQQMLFLMDSLVRNGRIPPFPIHVDSPMAVQATGIYEAFPDGHRTSLTAPDGQNVLQDASVHLHQTVAESRTLNALRGPAVIISSSGMLTGGRILHHCRVRLPKHENTLLITGYQGAGTLGRALLEGAHTVRIHKEDVPVRAEVTELRGLSGHADASEILRWLSAVKAPPKTVFLTHGEDEAAQALAGRISRERSFQTHVPRHGEVVELSAGARA
jgi:metallo-beta-lactamase family protein